MAQLSSPAERLASLRSVLAAEPEPATAVTHLLRLCRDEHAVLREHVGDPACQDRVETALRPLTDLLPSALLEQALTDRVRRGISEAVHETADTPAVVIAHAIAERLDDRYGHTFAGFFRQRSPYQPQVGDPVPLDYPALRAVTGMPFTAPPWRLANRLDETRHLRLAGEWAVQFHMVFDYSLDGLLAELVTADTVIATCHPNRSLEELGMAAGSHARAFPVGPVDPTGQRARIDDLIARAVNAGASIVVLPELCVTEDLAVGLEDWVRRPDGPRLLVAGSYHHQDDRGTEGARRRNTALAWVRGHEHPLTHDKHSPADRPVLEDVQPQGWPELRVYVADGWHVVLAICRDLLNPEAVHALTEAGANLILVPALSETLMTFGAPVAQLVGSCQALVAVANNPGDWSSPGQPPTLVTRALFGHPGFPRQTRPVQAPDPGPGVALLAVHTADVAWLAPPEDGAGASGHGDRCRTATNGAPPAWLERLTAESHPDQALAAGLPADVTLRPAAVLVLLTDGPHGPQVFLTERGPDLSNYPGRLVFPGGAVESGDGSVAATALREAREESGLDVATVNVIGLLPPLALPDAGFLVTPVLAWSGRPAFDRPRNDVEVAATAHVPLSHLGTALGTDPELGGDATAENYPLDLHRLGAMTTSVVTFLLGALSRGASPSTGSTSNTAP